MQDGFVSISDCGRTRICLLELKILAWILLFLLLAKECLERNTVWNSTINKI